MAWKQNCIKKLEFPRSLKSDSRDSQTLFTLQNSPVKEREKTPDTVTENQWKPSRKYCDKTSGKPGNPLLNRSLQNHNNQEMGEVKEVKLLRQHHMQKSVIKFAGIMPVHRRAKCLYCPTRVTHSNHKRHETSDLISYSCTKCNDNLFKTTRQALTHKR